MTLDFKQSIAANDALRTGAYSKTADVHAVHDDALKRHALILITLALAGCGGSSSSEEELPAEPTADAALEIGSVAVNPGDGTLLIGSTSGSFRLPAGRQEPGGVRAVDVGRGQG